MHGIKSISTNSGSYDYLECSNANFSISNPGYSPPIFIVLANLSK